MENSIKVSIICITYNHEKYIRKAIEGFLMQKVNFNYEILIHDDASIDNTVNILREYERKYPDIIKVIYQKENQYSKGKPVTSNLLKIAQGEYFAFCEGDDYWIDKNKLQKQIDFLEKNREYYAVYHNVLIVNEDEKEIDIGRGVFPIKTESEIDKIDKKNFFTLPGQAASLVSKNFYKYLLEKKIDMDSYKINGDVKFPIIFLSNGKIKILEDMMSAYRRTYTGDSWNARVKNKNLKGYEFQGIIEYNRLIKDLMNKEMDIKEELAIKFMESLIYLKEHFSKESLKISINIWKKVPNKVFTLKYIIERIIKKIKNEEYIKNTSN